MKSESHRGRSIPQIFMELVTTRVEQNKVDKISERKGAVSSSPKVEKSEEAPSVIEGDLVEILATSGSLGCQPSVTTWTAWDPILEVQLAKSSLVQSKRKSRRH
ncbi:hypothetical protein EAG_01689 [Camponotus floridanus]|uniref:Uncharacterized protein n=1 Tax=Camponotus floridanus TaxID=104421 RepID=E2ADJ7_CAMFO|nr:hypothetical protein EAG_01689 [Camponotus floridanus]